jgi:Protein of unknown function (DUF3160)
MVLGAGPVMSYYEFKWPMDQRLTDEQWSIILGNATAPAAPDWVGSFTNPVTFSGGANTGSNTALRVSVTVPNSGGVALKWESQSSQQYRVFYSDDLVNWRLLQTPVVAGQATAGLLDAGASPQQRRFYRLELVQ